MKYGITAKFIKVAFSKTAFRYMAEQVPSLDIDVFRRKVYREYREMVERTPEVGSLRENAFVMALYAACFFLAMYKIGREFMTDELVEGLVKEVSYCKAMRMAKEGKSAFTEKEIRNRTKQSQWTRDHIDKYPENWYYYFDKVEGKDEYYITHKECAICKLAKREGCEEVTHLLCKMDYYAFDLQGAVLDRTKTLGAGDDECNFHVMSKERAKEIGFVQSPNAK
ncbi:MAG: L-2-amino-thiazoline-4-carboxylic acid hydrolase [Peptostreptococcaceae bacterium]|nr:L-2-amino-thiazoline-4-carboxylic acid hydrolase [Peptostreptococcaceae bacterium]